MSARKAIDELVAIGERAFGDAPPSESIEWRGPALPKSVTRGTALQPGDKLNVRGDFSIGEASLVSRLIVLAYQFGEAAARQEIATPPDAAKSDANRLILEIKSLASEDYPEDGVMFIYTEVDDLLRAGSFDVCDLVLSADWSDLPVVHALALLSETSAARDSLKCRAQFAARVRERLLRDDPNRAEDLLRGLE